MIKKIYRLKEKDVKKVLKFWKPFFSYWIVLNKVLNKLPYSRFSLVLGSKVVNTNITRNFFRRRYYNYIDDVIKANSLKKNYDVTLVVKKKIKLDMKDKSSLFSFDKDLRFLIKKWLINNK